MSVHHHISQITASETLLLRQKVLKPFLVPEECGYPNDELKTSYHFGLFHAEKLVSIATFVNEPHAEFSAGNPYRLRGVATDPLHRSQGFGQILLIHGTEFLKERRCDFIWCNARENAFSFYTKLGFRLHGPLFELTGIGPHKVMYKHVFPR